MPRTSSYSNQPFPQYLAEKLEGAIANLPNGFYSTFDFTTTGQCLTHPITIALLAQICYYHPKIKHVGVDVRLNDRKGTRFNPDIVAYENDNLEVPMLFVDYESPNSSDRRILKKDIEPYVAWMQQGLKSKTLPNPVPYIVITTLPDEKAKWKLLYVRDNNFEEANMLTKIERNPLKFWTKRYKEDFGKSTAEYPISLLNISGKTVKPIIF